MTTVGRGVDAAGAAVGAVEFDDDRGRVDRDAIWAFLSTEAYWGRSRTRADVEAQLDGAWRVVGAYDSVSGELVGYARAVSDGVSFGYLADVFVVPGRRGQRLGHGLVRTMIDEGPGARFRWMLHTRDAHGLYRQYGFTEPGSNVLERAAQP